MLPRGLRADCELGSTDASKRNGGNYEWRSTYEVRAPPRTLDRDRLSSSMSFLASYSTSRFVSI
jgi:hypothetical protein